MLMKSMPWAVPMVLRSPEGEGGSAGGSGEGGEGSAGAAGDKGGGAGDKSGTQVPLAKHKEILDKLHAQNEEFTKVKNELQALKDAEKTRNDKSAADKGDFKSLYESALNEKKDLQGRFDQFKKDVINTSRYEALEKKLKSEGLKEGGGSVIDFADFEKMPFETTSKGRIIVHGVDEMAATLKKNYPYLFGSKPTSNINTGGGAGGGGDEGGGDETVTAAQVLEAEDAAKKDPKLKPAYEAKYRKYLEQQKQTRL